MTNYSNADINQINNPNNYSVTLYNQSNSNPFNELLFNLKKEQNNTNSIQYSNRALPILLLINIISLGPF